MIYLQNSKIHKYQYRPKEELYDIINDPYQMHNLIDDVKYASEVKKVASGNCRDGWTHKVIRGKKLK